MSAGKLSAAGPQLTPEQMDLVERYVAAYNAVDKELRRRMRMKDEADFSDVVRAFTSQHPSWSSSEQKLVALGRLRNFLVHEHTRPHERLAVPTPESVEALETILERLAKRVIPTFKRDVITLQPSDTLATVLGLIAKHSYSQFPVVDAGGEYRGLLTENGITRWLARHTAEQMTLVEFQDATVADVLEQEEKRKTTLFVNRDQPADVVLSAFMREPHLEAVLITHSGKENEKLLGIATRWDLDKVVDS